MNIKYVYCILAVTVLWFGAVTAGAEEATPHALTATDQKTHAMFMRQLSPSQVKAVSGRYPDFRILTLCSGRFSGTDREELVLGIWKPAAAKDGSKREMHRIGLIWNGKAWAVHLIDDEIKKDEKISRSFPLQWQYAFDEKGFSGGMKCGIESEFKDGSELAVTPGNKPFFDLNEKGLLRHKPVCFATSDTYNNWDCLVYSPKDGRFRLWFQQVHAD